LYVLWLTTAFAWAVIAALLFRGLSHPARAAALAAHGLTPFATLLICSLIGFGSLYATIALAAEWWALAAVTRLRPERLADPLRSGLAGRHRPAGLRTPRFDLLSEGRCRPVWPLSAAYQNPPPGHSTSQRCIASGKRGGKTPGGTANAVCAVRRHHPHRGRPLPGLRSVGQAT
jgi:hypothetical protein